MAVRLVDEDEARQLNRDYRGKDYAPNVLSFPLDDDFPLPPGEPRPLGDIVLCLPVVQAEAAEYGKTFEQRLAHLLIHGLLHLAGHSHDEEPRAPGHGSAGDGHHGRSWAARPVFERPGALARNE